MGIYIFIVILILIVCLMLAVIVLVQNSKGGGLAANFSAPNQIMGVRKTTDFLEKATWTLAIVLVVLSIAATATIPSHHVSNSVEQSEINTELPSPIAPAAETPLAPAE